MHDNGRFLGASNKKPHRDCDVVFGAGNQNRTDDLVITNDVLYRLSHTSMSYDFDIIPNIFAFVNSFLKNIFTFLCFFD